MLNYDNPDGAPDRAGEREMAILLAAGLGVPYAVPWATLAVAAPDHRRPGEMTPLRAPLTTTAQTVDQRPPSRFARALAWAVRLVLRPLRRAPRASRDRAGVPRPGGRVR